MPQMMRHLSIALIAAVLLQPMQAQAKNKHVGEAIAAGVIGLAVGAALSKKHKHHHDIYYPNYTPPYQPGAYDPYWNGWTSPAPGVACYPAQRACYGPDGTYARKWSKRMYEF